MPAGLDGRGAMDPMGDETVGVSPYRYVPKASGELLKQGKKFS